MKKLLWIILIFAASNAVAQNVEYSIVFLNKKEGAAKISEDSSKRLMEGHFANMARLAGEGKLLAAGPFNGGGGIFIMATGERVVVEEWISTDPAVRAQRWNIEILPYVPRHGGVCPVGENYTMTTYDFVRFTPDPMKYNASRYPSIMKKHDKYLKKLIATGNVITEATFGVNEGGLIIMKGEVDRKVFEADPGVAEGLIFLDLKKLYIAKGSFCEE